MWGGFFCCEKSWGLYFSANIKQGEIQLMDFETFVKSLWQYLSQSDNAYFVLYAAATCLLTQICKKLFVSKVKVDVLHKFDFATILPFIFGAGFAAFDFFVVKRIATFSVSIAFELILTAVAIGALASTIFKFFKSLSGTSLSDLMKNDVFGVFYTQLMYFGNVREQLVNKQLTLADFIAQVKLIAANAEAIYRSNDSVDSKRCQLAKLLGGIVDEKSIEACITALNDALISYISAK